MPKMTRRNFLRLTGGTGVALAVDPPRKLVNKLIPQVIPPKNIKPGEWAFFATTCRECPAGCGMHLWHRDGRVTKRKAILTIPGEPGRPLPRGSRRCRDCMIRTGCRKSAFVPRGPAMNLPAGMTPLPPSAAG
ncbi:twin-arginine translocation signal domain-containing protein [Geotalea toluenoxydans]|uniref:twin-arginine translocation signal domain-containing protein n=1 Tax=Geotalea toluenoxydans TaxID=421624 RepID=UPI0006D067A5|nr:twin-arginine translocation signal domain-containing protein [Geotalea toluenoxydans]